MPTVRYLESDELADLATPAEYVDVVRAGYRERGTGAPAEPRTTLTSSASPGMLTGYLAILPELGYMGGYTYAAGFASADAWFTLPLFDADAGELVAILDGAAMNPFKTGAAGAVAVDALARADASRLGVIGSGPQARGQVLTTANVRELEEVLVYSPTAANREAFAAEMDERLDATTRAVGTPTDLVPEVDVLVTATTASEPVFDGALLEPGTHVTAMGQYHPNRREIDTQTIADATYVIDLEERIHQDAGAFMHTREAGHITDDHVHGELGSVVAGTAAGRTTDDEITVFDSGGTAIETVAAASLLYERARDDGRGTMIDLSPASDAFPGR